MRRRVSPILGCRRAGGGSPGEPARPRGGRTLFTLIALVLSSLTALAQEPADLVKGAYLPKFLGFIRWPNGDGEKLICIMGRDPFGGAVKDFIRVEGISARVVEVGGEQSIGPCNLLYVSDSEASRLSTILAEAERKRVLTVSDIEGFAEHGGTIELTIRRNKVRFIINREDAERKGIEISAQLLLLSKKHED